MKRVNWSSFGLAALAAVLMSPLGACTSSGERAAPSETSYMTGDEKADSVPLRTGEVAKGRIIRVTQHEVFLETEDSIRVIPKVDISGGYNYSKANWRENTAPPITPAPSGQVTSRALPSTWLPRNNRDDDVRGKAVYFFESHPFDHCMGQLAKPSIEIPELVLLAEPGGSITVHDPDKAFPGSKPAPIGFHTHLWPGDISPARTEEEGAALEIPLAKGDSLLSSLAIVSPAVEIKNRDSEAKSYVPPYCLFANIKPLDAGDGLLSAQRFIGDNPKVTKLGDLFAFSLVKSSKQFLVYLHDGTGKHSDILKTSYVAYGSVILPPYLMIDVKNAAGAVVSRIFAVEFPRNVAADGPAPEPITVYSGPTQDPARITDVPMPPRHSLSLPDRSIATKAVVTLSYFEIKKGIPETYVHAWGTGRPSESDVKVKSDALDPGKPDHVLRIDHSGIEEPERWPVVTWMCERRTWVWREAGGLLGRRPRLPVPAAAPVPLTSAQLPSAYPHAIPLTFRGPKATLMAGSGSGGIPAGVAGGMTSGVIGESLAREAGGAVFNPIINPSLGANLTPGGGSTIVNQTYVIMGSPIHQPVSGSGSGYPTGRFYSPGKDGLNYSSPAWERLGRNSPMGPMTGTIDPGGNVRDLSGNVIYDPATGGTYQGGDYGAGMGATIDPVTGSLVPNPTLQRRRR